MHLRRLIPTIVALLGAFLCAIACSQPSRDPSTARVVKVIDGDTVELQDSRRVRIAGIDTPELRPIPEPGAEDARARLGELVDGQDVRVEIIPPGTDIHGRTLARLHLPDGRDVGALLVREGLAVVFVAREQRRGAEYFPLEAQARHQSLGIWRHVGTHHVSKASPALPKPILLTGRVSALRRSGPHVFLDFSRRGQVVFTAVFYEEVAAELGDVLPSLEGRTVSVVGDVREGPRGHPEMVVQHSSRLVH